MSTGPGPAAGESIGQRLKRLRLEHGLSQRELASPGVSYAYISRIEAGTRQPSVKALRRLAAKLGVPAEYLETGSQLDPAEQRELRLADLELAVRLSVSDGVDEQLQALVDEAILAGDRACILRGRVALASLALESGQFVRAVDLLEAAIEGDPFLPVERFDIYANLGRAYAAAGRPDRAVDLYERCIQQVREVEGDSTVDARYATLLSYALSDMGELAPRRRSRARGARPRAGLRRSVHARPPLLVDGAARARRGRGVGRARERAQGDRAAAGDGRLVPSRACTHARREHLALARRHRLGVEASRPCRPAARRASVDAGLRRDQDSPLTDRRVASARARTRSRWRARRSSSSATRLRRTRDSRSARSPTASRSAASIRAPTRRTGARRISSRRRVAGATRPRHVVHGHGSCARTGTKSRRSTSSTVRPSWGCGQLRPASTSSVDDRPLGRSFRSVLARALGTACRRRDAHVPRRRVHRRARGRRAGGGRARAPASRRDGAHPRRLGRGRRPAALDPRARRRPLRISPRRPRRPAAVARGARAARAAAGARADGRARASPRVLRPADRGEGRAEAGAGRSSARSAPPGRTGSTSRRRRRISVPSRRRSSARSACTNGARPRSSGSAAASTSSGCAGCRPTRSRAGSSASAGSARGRSASSASRGSAATTRGSSATSGS